jgi:hypothetical protein
MELGSGKFGENADGVYEYVIKYKDVFQKIERL